MWPAKWQWAGNIRWKWWKDGHKSSQLALFILVHSLARKHASTPIPPLHPARPERKGSLLFSHNGSKRAAKTSKTKGSAGRDILGNAASAGRGKRKVDEQDFMMHLLVLMTRKPGRLFQHLLIFKLRLNQWILHGQRAVTPAYGKLLHSKGQARASDHFKVKQVQLLLSQRWEATFGGRM